MVACQIGKQSAGKVQTADTLLCDGVAGAFHEGIFAACLHHLGQQLVQLNGVGGGMVGSDGFTVDVVADGRQQTTMMTELPEHII